VQQINNEVVSHIPPGIRVVNGLFLAASTRTAGFSCLNIADLHPAVKASYMIMMYISVFPIAISIRRTNVYEEKSLGVYKKDDAESANENSAMSYVGTHLRRQLSFDLWYVFLGLFILAISEGSRIQAGDFDMFAVLFEIVSAYGTVGLSLGYTGINASLSAEFTTVGKLVIIAMMIRGRHRGLPYGLDRAILLPSEKRFEKEAAEAQPIIIRSPTAMTGGSTTGMRRGSFGGRSGRSRSADRNLISQFLHPGPVLPHSETHSKHRDHLDLPMPKRSQSQAAATDDEGDWQDPTESRSRPRRVETAPVRSQSHS
jgi:hypothetical protein